MHTISRTALVAAALGLSAAIIGAGAVYAQDSSSEAMPSMDMSLSSAPSDDTPIEEATDFTAKVDIPTVSAVDASMDEAAIRDALGLNFLKHVDELSKLTAASVTLPEVDLTYTTTTGSTSMTTTAVYKNVVLSNIKDGVVGTFTIGSSSMTQQGSGSPSLFNYNSSTYSDLDIGGTFAFLGLIQGDPTAALKPVMSHFQFDGGTYEGDGFKCTIGKVTGQTTSAKPSPVSFTDLSAAFEQVKATKGSSEPPAAAVKTLISYIGNLLRDFAIAPSHFDGLSCSGGDAAKPTSISFGAIDVAAWQNAVYPDISFKDIKVDAGDNGKFSLDSAVIKSFDLNPPIDALLSADTLDDAWFKANGRRLIPSWGGLALTGLSLDVPDPSAEGSRITASVKDFDLTMSDYLNGLPTKVSTKADGVDVPIPPTTTDDTEKMLLALGINRLNLGFEASASWDKASQQINIDKLSLSGADLGSAAVAMVLGNASADLFSLDSATEEAAGMGLTVKSFEADATDAGIGDKIVPLIAAQNNADPATFRTQIAGTAEAVVLQVFGATPEANALAQALGNFITGTAKSITVTGTSKDPAGVPTAVFAQAGDNPTILAGVMTVTGSAK